MNMNPKWMNTKKKVIEYLTNIEKLKKLQNYALIGVVILGISYGLAINTRNPYLIGLMYNTFFLVLIVFLVFKVLGWYYENGYIFKQGGTKDDQGKDRDSNKKQ